ncbi:hypothetical protein GCM10018793_39160 [Streptomyces sulfonofaciens]|uniref:Phage tail protein n=1 Tax=Streptomyces sulfonofaciens TaxID=68272 RepID=A0A919GBM9_9ACTN|nr:spherulation-specific family 4 protein [Streptomyces sulfonofaciens]GHH81545.1 hypothetical protein GCM10018793_39160 [Streptomyces sulfonofaciens]
MPHLTRSAPGTASSVTLGVGVPGYAHPLVAPVEWAELTRPGTPLHWVALNVADGPGSRPDPHCLDAVRRLRNTGVDVLGHLDLARGTRPFPDLIRDVHHYVDWYRVGGFLLDRCPWGPAELPGVRRLASALRGLVPGAHLVLGHGRHPNPGYAEIADQMVTFSGSWGDYRWSQAEEWTAAHPALRFCHLVYGLPRGHLEEALRIARWQGAATVFFTDRTQLRDVSSPWEALPGYWDELVSLIGRGVSE